MIKVKRSTVFFSKYVPNSTALAMRISFQICFLQKLWIILLIWSKKWRRNRVCLATIACSSILGSSSDDLLMCRRWNFKFQILRKCFSTPQNQFKTEKKKFYCSQFSCWTYKKSFSQLKVNIKENHSKNYATFKIPALAH